MIGVQPSDHAKVRFMQRAFRILIGSFLLLTELSAGQQNPNPVSTEMKEILLIQKAKTGDAQAQSEVVRLAESGDPKAEFALGQNYEYGMWSSKDHTQAMLWYRKAAEHGDIDARLSLGQMYFDGREVKQDFNEAARWYGCPKPSESILARCARNELGKIAGRSCLSFEKDALSCRTQLRRRECARIER